MASCATCQHLRDGRCSYWLNRVGEETLVPSPESLSCITGYEPRDDAEAPRPSHEVAPVEEA